MAVNGPRAHLGQQAALGQQLRNLRRQHDVPAGGQEQLMRSPFASVACSMQHPPVPHPEPHARASPVLVDVVVILLRVLDVVRGHLLSPWAGRVAGLDRSADSGKLARPGGASVQGAGGRVGTVAGVWAAELLVHSCCGLLVHLPTLLCEQYSYLNPGR